MKYYKTIYEFLKQENVDENLEVNDTLNPKLWDLDSNNLKEDIHEKILGIIDEFKNILKDKEIPLDIQDIRITGSNANYNYTDNSDLDVHILANLPDDDSYLDKVYEAYKTIFNSKYDITLNNIPVEIYVEDKESSDLKSNGVYSVLNSKWLIEPKKEIIPELDEVELNNKINEWKKRYDDILNNPKDDHSTIELIDSFMDDIYKIRQEGLKNEGEFSFNNQLFKELRNLGLFDNLKNLRIEILNNILSI